MDEEIKIKVNKILSETLDWDYIVECSVRQGISSLLYWNLSKIRNGKAVSYEVMKKLEKMYYSNLARNILLYDELSKVLKAFKRAGIDTIVLKGAFLAEKIYLNVGLRPMSDLDLLIKEKNLTKVKNELNGLMYFDTYHTKYYEQLQTVLSNEHLFIHKNKEIHIDLHWNILPPENPYKIDINKLWENARPINIANVETLVLAPEDLLQHLCLHLDNHINYSTPAAQHFKNYCDIAEVTMHYREIINWSYFLQNSKNCGIENPIYHGLFIAEKSFGAFVPGDVLNALEPAKSNTGLKETFDGLMQDNSNKKNKWKRIKFYMKLEKVIGIRNKLHLLSGYIFPSKEFMMYHYSIEDEKKIYKYYLIRSGRVLKQGLRILWKLPNYIFRSAFSK
jgi:hypothetical protein